MPNIKDHAAGTEPARPGIDGELKQLKSNGAATAGELRELIGSLKGKSPEEVLGAVAQSGLTRSIAAATIGLFAVLVVFTVIPYGYHKIWPEEANAATAQADGVVEQENSEPSKNQTLNPDVSAGEIPASAGDLPDKLGIGETKASSPNSNPLESNSKLDNLLDGIE